MAELKDICKQVLRVNIFEDIEDGYVGVMGDLNSRKLEFSLVGEHGEVLTIRNAQVKLFVRTKEDDKLLVTNGRNKREANQIYEVDYPNEIFEKEQEVECMIEVKVGDEIFHTNVFNRRVKKGLVGTTREGRTTIIDLVKVMEFADSYNEKMEALNTNARQLGETFDRNSQEKTRQFNENSQAKTGEYNNNHQDKVNEYNSNHSTKFNEYNTNNAQKLETYNNNHTNKLNEYNTNHEQKLTEYNNNTASKVEEYNNLHQSMRTAANNDLRQRQYLMDEQYQRLVGEYNNNHSHKLNELEVTHEQKLTEYNNNATSKVEEYNSLYNSKKQELETFNNDVETKRTALENQCNNTVSEVREMHTSVTNSKADFDPKYTDFGEKYNTLRGISDAEAERVQNEARRQELTQQMQEVVEVYNNSSYAALRMMMKQVYDRFTNECKKNRDGIQAINNNLSSIITKKEFVFAPRVPRGFGSNIPKPHSPQSINWGRVERKGQNHVRIPLPDEVNDALNPVLGSEDDYPHIGIILNAKAEIAPPREDEEGNIWLPPVHLIPAHRKVHPHNPGDKYTTYYLHVVEDILWEFNNDTQIRITVYYSKIGMTILPPSTTVEYPRLEDMPEPSITGSSVW